MRVGDASSRGVDRWMWGNGQIGVWVCYQVVGAVGVEVISGDNGGCWSFELLAFSEADS